MDDNNLGEQIKKLRIAKKMTLAVIAERLGVTTSAIASYENGSRKPSFDMLIKIARLFNVTIDNLLGYTNKDFIEVTGLSITQREHIQSMVATYQKFNELIITMLELKRDDLTSTEIEFYYSTSFERFKKDITELKKRK